MLRDVDWSGRECAAAYATKRCRGICKAGYDASVCTAGVASRKRRPIVVCVRDRRWLLVEGEKEEEAVVVKGEEEWWQLRRLPPEEQRLRKAADGEWVASGRHGRRCNTAKCSTASKQAKKGTRRMRRRG